MIINSKTVSLFEATVLLGKSEQEVLQLSQYGYLEQSKPESGKTRINLSSLERYANRSGIALQEVRKPSLKISESLSVQDTMTKLGLRSEAAVHRLIQAGKLKAQMEKGIYKVDAGSVRNYILGA
ncbi:hypothetical protein AV545_13585 [Paenibacillus jamilae]|uniref:hypothetical protein n=1 Tax=Paenibacillus jamilae TaxID=114136 RepID=UPI0007AC0F07|nr:hypothetical protein [Paenibacillus jamilae]KZE73922.1 hypothetical protein AV545_13585 [Paenibacillus jamilae]